MLIESIPFFQNRKYNLFLFQFGCPSFYGKTHRCKKTIIPIDPNISEDEDFDDDDQDPNYEPEPRNQDIPHGSNSPPAKRKRTMPTFEEEDNPDSDEEAHSEEEDNPDENDNPNENDNPDKNDYNPDENDHEENEEQHDENVSVTSEHSDISLASTVLLEGIAEEAFLQDFLIDSTGDFCREN